MKRGYLAIGLGLVGLAGGYKMALESEKRNLEHIDSVHYGKLGEEAGADSAARALYEQGKALEEEGMELSAIASHAPEMPGRWEEPAEKLEGAAMKYTEVIRKFPGSMYASLSRQFLSNLYMDPVLQEKGVYNEKVETSDTIPLGDKTVIIDFVDRRHDTQVGYRLFGADGKEIDLNKLNPFSESRTISLHGEDWTAGEITSG